MKNHVIIIAEAGVNHNGDLEMAKKMKDSGMSVDTIIAITGLSGADVNSL